MEAGPKTVNIDPAIASMNGAQSVIAFAVTQYLVYIGLLALYFSTHLNEVAEPTLLQWLQVVVVAGLFPACLYALGTLRPVAVFVAAGLIAAITMLTNPILIVLFLPVYLSLLLLSLRALGLSSYQRQIARPLAHVSGPVGLLRTLFSSWPGLRRGWWQSFASGASLYLSTVFTGFGVLSRYSGIFGLVASAVIAFSPAIEKLPELTNLNVSDAELKTVMLTSLLSYSAMLFLGGSLLVWLAQRLRSAARYLSRQSLEKQISRDSRPPILFLRSFHDDQVTLPKRTLWERFLQGDPSRRQLDHMLVESFSRYGPVVAIGRPGERTLPFGAARKYVADDAWREEVKQLAAQAAHIVVVADPTPGIAWEIETMLQPEYLAKTLFLAAPGRDLRNNPLIERRLASASDGRTKSIVLAFFQHHGMGAVLSATKQTEAAYQAVLQAFFRRPLKAQDI